MTNFRDFLRETKSAIPEIDADAAASGLARGEFEVLDVREDDEVRHGMIPGAHHLSRAHFESRIEDVLPDKARPVVVYCQSGVRSVFAARTMKDLGYENVRSLSGGFVRWKDRGLDASVPRTFTAEQRDRYSRHLLLPEVGHEGQMKLMDAKVLCIGAGGLGSPALLYLAAAGVGTIGIVDDDVVEENNLQRQVIHDTDRVGTLKAESARSTINKLNPEVKVNVHALRIDGDNARDLIGSYDVVIDGSDNFETRYVINEVSVDLGIPVVHGSIFRFEGMISTFSPDVGPCYRCLYPEAPPPELAPT